MNIEMAKPMPAFFFGHGNPMNTLYSNGYTKAWSEIGLRLPKPKAVLCISAHWYIRGTGVTVMRSPPTIHDFGGFPEVLFQIEYPAPGDPALAARIARLLEPIPVSLDNDWGLDHGTWLVLRHVFPDANVPVLQLSIDATKPPSFHYALGKQLGSLRDEGVLIIGSGNIAHNLRAYDWSESSVAPLDWAVRFENLARQLLLARDHESLTNYASLGPDAHLAIPTPDHYLPLLYVIGLQRENEQVTFPVEGFDGGSMSMLTVEIA